MKERAETLICFGLSYVVSVSSAKWMLSVKAMSSAHSLVLIKLFKGHVFCSFASSY